MAVERLDGRRSIGGLLRELAEGSAALVRGEIRLARMETAAALAGIRDGTVMMATGGVLALLGGLSVVAGLVLLIGDQWLPRDLYWVAAFVVMLISGGIAFWLSRRGMTLLSPAEIAPNETVTTLKEDKEWLKQRLTSGATSS
jgi:drug/metabolite transporter (DMT)-like permease